MNNHLFRITREVWDACTGPEVQATVEALRTAGLYALPYDCVDIEAPVDCVVNWTTPPGKADDRRDFVKVKTASGEYWRSNFGASVVVRLTGVTTIPGMPIVAEIIDYKHRTRFKLPAPGTQDVDRPPELLEYDRRTFSDLLITLLATRNAHKETKQNKLAKLGIGKKRMDAQYEYTTTITAPMYCEMQDDEEHPPTGRTVCAHLRRAHIRNVRFGPGRQYAKPKLIAAVFVNADKEWTKSRVAYNVNL